MLLLDAAVLLLLLLPSPRCSETTASESLNRSHSKNTNKSLLEPSG